MIQLDRLSKSYGSKQVLHDISLEFAPGGVYGIVGENGSGKTTLFRCIAGLEVFDGLITPDPAQLKNRLGFLQTEPFFFSKITGREYIRLLCNARGCPADDIDRRNVFELPLDQYAATYSTGMKKKLALTAILMQDNTVFILDEPYNGVDIHSNILITEIIRKLRDLGKTVVISSHIFGTLHDTCDEIHLLRDGRFVKKALPADFDALEREMRDFTVGNKIDRLGLH